jgi:DNA-binding NarL/FixJ family response regulator
MKAEISMSIKVLIVDDKAMVRQDLRTLLGLSEDIKIVGEATNGQEAIDQVDTLRPDVVLLDLEMPVLDGYEAASQIRTRFPSSRIVALTVHSCAEDYQHAFEAGVDTFVVKGAPIDELIKAILEGKKEI